MAQSTKELKNEMEIVGNNMTTYCNTNGLILNSQNHHHHHHHHHHHNSIPNLCTLSPQFHTKKGVTTLPYPIYVLCHHNSIPKRCVTIILYPIYVLCHHNSIPERCVTTFLNPLEKVSPQL